MTRLQAILLLILGLASHSTDGSDMGGQLIVARSVLGIKEPLANSGDDWVIIREQVMPLVDVIDPPKPDGTTSHQLVDEDGSVGDDPDV